MVRTAQSRRHSHTTMLTPSEVVRPDFLDFVLQARPATFPPIRCFSALQITTFISRLLRPPLIQAIVRARTYPSRTSTAIPALRLGTLVARRRSTWAHLK